MALVFNQTPPTLSLAQSPVAFSVYENTGLYSGSEFQYICQLTYWTGSASVSGSYDYYLTKYPNPVGVGIFDLSRVLNSALNQLAYDYTSSVLYYKAAFNYNYLNTSGVRVSGSNEPILSSSLYKSLDGYSLFPEPINQNAPSKSIHWPLMTDGPVTSSVLPSDVGSIGIYVGTTGATQPTQVRYTKIGGSSSNVAVSSSTASTNQITRVPLAPSQSGFPLVVSDGDAYTIQAYSGSNALGTPLYFETVCAYKYVPVRVLWKNRYGQFDYLNFYKANYKTFGTDQRTYQPQLGSWDATSLSYNTATNNSQRYIVNTTEQLDVNSDWLQEAFNEAYKQLLVSDEIYWLYDTPNNLVKPLSIITNNVRFKTGVNDKLIQYTVSFSIGQTFKLII
jgi:hypothetical protein